ncbi:dimer_Tnp_hAT domain-containing protein [Trichonephila clavipes]|nr:dimer_Tnp_hAT domain-containing protein [Trichonephila clavipes]
MSHSGPKEELLGLLPLKSQTRGEDIANVVIECMDKHHIPLDKIVSISTDRAKKYDRGASTHHGVQQGMQCAGDLARTRHGAYLEYTQNIMLQHQGEDPSCNPPPLTCSTNPTAMFPKRLIRLTGEGSLLPPVYMRGVGQRGRKRGVTVNSRRATYPLVKLVEDEKRWEASDARGNHSLIWGGTELNRDVTCMMLKATTNNRRTSRSSTCLRLWQLFFLPFRKDRTTDAAQNPSSSLHLAS